MTFSISAHIISRPPYQPETQSRVDMGRGMIAGMIWKRYVLIFLSYASDELFYEANKQNEIIKWHYMAV